MEQFKLVLHKIKASGKLDEEELSMLTVNEKELIKELFNEGLIDKSWDLLKDLDVNKEWGLLEKELATHKKSLIPIWKSVLKYAAIFICFVTLVYTFTIDEQSSNGEGTSENVITLKMGKDNLKIIRQGDSQQIVSSDGEVLGEQKGNLIRYKANLNTNKLIYNELEIPYGKSFDLELSDGTIVHLNSGTKIKYPVKFLTGKKREVYIDGEGYFNVAKDMNHPFIVHADDVAIEVLGTEFNISSYAEDMEIKAVLVEGSIQMSNSSVDDSKFVLEPGKKGSWNKISHSTKIEEVDIDMYTGWIKGELIFRNSTFSNLAKKLERSYNVSIHINNPHLEGRLLNARFNTKIESIEDVIKSIREIYPFRYRITDGNILID